MAKKNKIEKTELIKRMNKYFEFYDYHKASDILLEKLLKNDFSLYENFKEEVLTYDILNGKNTLEFDAMYEWYSYYLTDPDKGQYFTPPSMSKLSNILIDNLKVKITKAISYLLNQNINNKKDVKYLNGLQNINLFFIYPIDVIENIRKICARNNIDFDILNLDLPIKIYDPAAGVGSLIVENWYQNFSAFFPNHLPFMAYLAVVHEISEHTIPFLLFNLAYRGIQSVVIHGDSLTGNTFNIYTVVPNIEDENKLLPYGKITKCDISKENVLKRFNDIIPLKPNFLKYNNDYAEYMKKFK